MERIVVTDLGDLSRAVMVLKYLNESLNAYGRQPLESTGCDIAELMDSFNWYDTSKKPAELNAVWQMLRVDVVATLALRGLLGLLTSNPIRATVVVTRF